MTADLGRPYQGYLYAYPHKSAYRPFKPPRPLADLWRDEDRSRLHLYVHVPFCEVRCGFCNLFTQVGGDGQRSAYVDAVARHAAATRRALGRHRFVRASVGGGTPTALPPADLERLFTAVRLPAGAPLSVETSPDTVDDERLAVLAAAGATRVSIGVQSFHDDEVRALGRPQRRAAVVQALDRLRRGPWSLNVDLMYGMAGQTPASLVASVDAALAWRPEEVYLYPLYVRPLTGLARSARTWDDDRLALYRAGRDRLCGAGYTQRSMRSFVLPAPAGESGPQWCCQDDGMVGVGAGSRSYTAAVHWSTEYAVAQPEVRRIVAAFVDRGEEEHGLAYVGIDLDGGEQRRRWVVKSILRADGLDRAAYRRRFGADACHDLPVLVDLLDGGYLADRHGRLVPTALGLEWSDAMGPALVSEPVRRRSSEFVLR